RCQLPPRLSTTSPRCSPLPESALHTGSDPEELCLVLWLPPDRVRFFFKNQQRRSLRQRRLLPSQLLLPGRDPFLLRVFLPAPEGLQLQPLQDLCLPPLKVRLVHAFLSKKLSLLLLRKLGVAQQGFQFLFRTPILRPSLSHTLSVESHCNTFPKPSREGRL